jgi:cytochrome P460
MWVRALLLIAVLSIEPARAQSPAPVAFPREYKSRLVKYAVVDRADGFSRDLYVSKEALDALRQNPRLQEFPVGALFAIDVYSATPVGRGPKSQAPAFRTTADGHLARDKDERTLHLMQKTQQGFGSQTWTFAGFDPRTAAPLHLQLPGDCLLCHQAAVVSDMAFSLSLLRRFATTGAVQYSYCVHPGRQACAF